MTILFRADSSSKIGTGHIMRDLVLAKQYAAKGDKIIFATRNLQGNINNKIKEAGYGHITLKSNRKKELVRLIKKLHADILLIDHYNIGYKKERYIKEQTGIQILSFDDTYEKHYCDILLNHNISANKKKYKNLVPQHCELRCGKEYTLLREEFYKAKRKSYKKNRKKKRILLAMGGADSANLNIKILKVLKKCKKRTVHVVTTSANKNLAKLQKYAENKKWIRLHINATDIAELMAKSDFGIVTPSVVVNEAIFMDLPFIAIQTAENQKEIYYYLEKNHFDVMKKFSQDKLFFFSFLHLNAIQVKDFTQLNKQEALTVLQWRNHKSIRQWMYNQKKIPINQHLQYIKFLKTNKERCYFQVKHVKETIGVIDLTNITLESAEIGLYTKPSIHGTGNILMKTLLVYGFFYLGLKSLEAHVYKTNEKAIALYKRFGFQEHTQINNIYIMKLQKEKYVQNCQL
jgi:UDP-2,4-diacetamido-2,4,6-trideoxy-beta-L-altropyranose hydrolase/UDP-4-amino-4,6-dideoxy-N-acetyl-beta-L-altrosamine N-acetyltransferase